MWNVYFIILVGYSLAIKNAGKINLRRLNLVWKIDSFVDD
jgi:hypothetical protein